MVQISGILQTAKFYFLTPAFLKVALMQIGYQLTLALKLAFNAATQKNESVTPYLSDGKVYTRRVTDMTSDERAAAVTANNAAVAASNRARRDALLAESDWMVIKAQETSTTLNSSWATYRQALRDITSHSNWPNLSSANPDGSGDNDWPTEPS